jgi:hypothetical protein
LRNLDMAHSYRTCPDDGDRQLRHITDPTCQGTNS